jgi:hypothetical protein
MHFWDNQKLTKPIERLLRFVFWLKPVQGCNISWWKKNQFGHLIWPGWFCWL